MLYIYFLYWTDIKFSTLHTSNRFDKTSVQKKKGNILSSPLIKLYFIQSVTHSTDQENKVSKMFIISLITNRGRCNFTSNKLLNSAVHTVKYSLIN